MPDNWFSYREIAFQDKDCIIFIAENIETLEAGRWPEPPPGRRMSDGPINLLPTDKTKPKNKHYEPMRGREASFCRPESIAAEFRRRFELVTGSRTADHDRILFEEHFINGVETWRIARIKASPVWLCDYRIKRVLRFLTGKGLKYRDGRPANYAEWVAKRAKERTSGHIT
jgi:hypothetical protein